MYKPAGRAVNAGETISLAYRGRWMPFTDYAKGDNVSVDGVVTLVNTTHTSGATVDYAKFTSTEGTRGWVTTVDNIVFGPAALPSGEGETYIFLATPVGGLPAGISLGDIAYFGGGTEWIQLRSYNNAPSEIQIGSGATVQTYIKSEGTWTLAGDYFGNAAGITAIRTTSASLPSSSGTYIFLVTPVGGMPSGCALGDICQYNGSIWSRLRSYGAAPLQVVTGGVVWYKYKNTWACDIDWQSHTPVVTAYSGTNPVPTGVTVSMKYRVTKGVMEALYYRTGNASADPGVGIYVFSMPTGFSIDNTMATIDNTALTTPLGTNVRSQSHPIGVGMVNDNGKSAPLTVHAASTDKFYFQIADQASGNTRLSSSGWFPINAPLATVSAAMQIPVKRPWEA